MGQLFHRDAYQFRKDISERYGRVVRLLGLFSVSASHVSNTTRLVSNDGDEETATVHLRPDCPTRHSGQGAPHI